MRPLAVWVAGVALAAVGTCPAAADVVTLWSGQTIEGRILTVTDDTLEIQTKDGLVKVPRTDVRTVRTDAEIEAERVAAEAAARGTAGPSPAQATGPAVPTAEAPAGGWLLARTPDGQPLGYRHIRLVPKGDGFRLENREAWLTPHGKPESAGAFTLALDADLRPRGIGRVFTGQVLGRRKDLVSQLSLEGGRLRVNEAEDKSAPASREVAVPEGTVLGDTVLARLLHGAWLAKLVAGEPAPEPVPFAAVEIMGTGRESVEVLGPGEIREDGCTPFAVKVVREYPGTEIPRRVERIVVGWAPGKPVRLLEIEMKGLPPLVASTATEAGGPVNERLPDAWRRLALPEPPASPAR